MHRIDRHITYANVVAMIALVLSLGGTAYAALVITTANVKDRTLLGADVRDQTIGFVDLASGTRNELVGTKGDRGPDGIRGFKGPVGPQGDQGDAGNSTRSTTSWAFHDSGIIRDMADSRTPANSTPTDWDDTTYGTPAERQIRQGGFSSLPVQGLQTLLVGLSGISCCDTNQVYENSGLIETTFSGNLSAHATVTLLHRNYNEASGDTGGTPIHGRLKCWLGRGNGASPSDYQTMGTPAWVSAEEQHELVTITLAANGGNIGAGTYNVAAFCQDGNLASSSASWMFVSASINALVAEQ